jgi:hypothetical protein
MSQYSRICDHLFTPFYEMIFCEPAPRISKEVLKVVSQFGDCYIKEHNTYIRMYLMSILSYLPRNVWTG